MNKKKNQKGSRIIHKLIVARNLFLSIVSIIIIYSNLAIIYRHLPFKASPPVDALSHYLFNIYSVFSAYLKSNKDYVIWAHVRDKNTNELSWQRLNNHDYFPHKRGEQHARMLMRLHNFNLTSTEYKSAQQFTAKKIQLKYNREHTDKEAEQIVFGVEWWPKSRQSYEAFRTKKMTKKRTTFNGKVSVNNE